jgi:predicted Zn-dependent protease
VNSEGTRVRTGEGRVRLTLTAESRTEDGTDLGLSRTFEASVPGRLPAEAVLLAVADTLVRDLIALRAAPEVEPYSGPAILSGRASAVFFHEIFGHRIEGHRQKDEGFAQTFTHRLGEQVLPAFLSVEDDPTRSEFDGVELSGHYRVDDEGVAARRVSLIDDGVLSGFLMSRSPIAAAPHSNGHGRRQPGLHAVARQGNLLVTSRQTVTGEELRSRLIEEIRRQGKPYGYRFDEIQGGFTATGRITPQSFKVLPLKVYRVYADGRPDELVRGADIVGTPLTVFGKILATDDRPEVFNGVCGAESGQLSVSAVSPGILVQELEIEKRAKSLERPPILPVPPARDPGGARAQGDDDVVFRALSHELARSMDSLRLEGLARPHYMAYRVEDGVELAIDATFGAILNQNQVRTRRLEADVRVGTPQLDNTNFAGPGAPGALGWVEIGFDDSYGSMRRFAWRITDGRFKAAAERLARKQAALESRPPLEAPSFVAEPPRTTIEPAVALALDEAPWSDLARRASAVFREHAGIEESRVRVQVRHVNRYLIASDGARARTPETSYAVHVTAVARGPGGAVRDYRVFAAPAAAGLPEPAEILAEVRALAEDVSARARAETIENYTGPVLLEGRASPQFFHALLGRFLGGTPAPVVAGRATAPPRRLDPLFGQRVLPAGFGIVDDPTRADLAGVPLLGRYAIDEEGVAPRAVRVVDDGMMRAWLFSRIPARADDRSTGHGRDSSSGEVRPIIGNLIVEAATTVPAAELRRELLRLAQERGLGYGIVVRGLEDLGMLPPRPAARPARSELPPPVAVYRVLPDGREEPVRDVDFGETTIRALRDITAAGDPPAVYNFLQAGGASYLRWGATPISIAAPPVLVSELALLKSESSEKPPVLPHPFFTRN